MGKKMAELIDSFTDSENIEYSVFLNLSGSFVVRVRDLDAGENVGTVGYTTREAAVAAFGVLKAKVL